MIRRGLILVLAETAAEAAERVRSEAAAEASAAATRAARARASAGGGGGGAAVNAQGAGAVLEGYRWLCNAWQSLWGGDSEELDQACAGHVR